MATDPSPPQASPSALPDAQLLQWAREIEADATAHQHIRVDMLHPTIIRAVAAMLLRTPPPPALPDVRERPGKQARDLAERVAIEIHEMPWRQAADRIAAALQAQASESHAEGARAMREAAVQCGARVLPTLINGGAWHTTKAVVDKIRALPLPGQGET